jgi:uncharacterized damage-inducible protein DinB
LEALTKETCSSYLGWKSAAGQAHPVVNHLLTVKTYYTSRIREVKTTMKAKAKKKKKMQEEQSEAERMWCSVF